MVKTEQNSSSKIVLDDILPYVTNRLVFRMNQLLKQDLRKHGLTISNWRILAVLESNQRATVNELADYAMIEQSTLSRLIARMENDGLLFRKKDEIDGRTRAISLTPLGHDKYDMVREMTRAHSDRAVQGLSEDEKAQFMKVIAIMRTNLDRSLTSTDGE